MPALLQLRFNAACLAHDLATGQWRKLPFHWAGLKRGLLQYARFEADLENRAYWPAVALCLAADVSLVLSIFLP